MNERSERTIQDGDAALSVKNLWKIFGRGADRIVGTPDAEPVARRA